MTVYEIKDPKPIPAGEAVKSRRRNVKPVSPTALIRPIDFLTLKREWGGSKGESRDRKKIASKEALRAARSVINLINDHLETLEKGIHIALKEGEEGYVLDVHDCSDGNVCDKVAELPFVIEELPILLKKLQQEAGILLDRQL